MGFSLVATSRGTVSPVAVHRLLIAKASLVEHGLQGMQASVVGTHGLSGCVFQSLEQRLSSCGTWA